MLPTRYIFNHIPKTGGTSLLAICRYNLPESQISPHLRQAELSSGSRGRLQAYALIAGHFSLAAHTSLSSGRYSMTLLRDPIRTIHSTYVYWRGVSENNPLVAKAKELSFADFVEYFYHTSLITNPFRHYFAGASFSVSDNSLDGPRLLATAKHNLSIFNFVGICEEFERSARLLCRELGWQLPEQVPHENRSGSEREADNITPATMRILRERNQLDFELYAYAIKLMQKQERLSLSADEHRTEYPSQRFLPCPILSYSRASFQSVSAAWLPGTQSGVLEFAVTFRTRVHVPDLILGVAIFDEDGKNMWGTNTLLEGLKLQNESGCTCCAAFIVQCDAPPATYSVTVALHQLRLHDAHDHWLDHAAFFQVERNAGSVNGGSFKLLQFHSSLEWNSNMQPMALDSLPEPVFAAAE